MKNLFSINILNALILLSLALAANATTLTEKERALKQQRFVNYMHKKHGFAVGELHSLLNNALFRKDIIEKITTPWESKPWYIYRKIFIRQPRIDKGVEFMRTHQHLLTQAKKHYGVSPYIITAILGVETKYGEITGDYPVLEALVTLGFGYLPRSKFFTKQLEEFLLMTRTERLDPMQPKGSYAGAMGLPQFIPSSFHDFAVDFDQDGKRDLWSSADAIGSIANYLAKHRWQEDKPIAIKIKARPKGLKPGKKKGQKPNYSLKAIQSAGIRLDGQFKGNEKVAILKYQNEDGPEYWLGFNNFYSITRYNHSNLYALAVFQLAEEIRKSSAMNIDQ